MRFWVKKPGLTLALEAKDFIYTNRNGADITAYEKILYDCIVGDQTLFTNGDEVRAAWAFITPILEHWETLPLLAYTMGSEGPETKLKKEITTLQINEK